jgi:hypothetical protein
LEGFRFGRVQVADDEVWFDVEGQCMPRTAVGTDDIVSVPNEDLGFF